MGAIVAIISALVGLAGPLSSLFSDVLKGWSDLHTTGTVNVDTLGNDALGAAQAAVDLETDVQKQLALVEQTLSSQHPGSPVTQIKAVSAMAVEQARNARAASIARASKP